MHRDLQQRYPALFGTQAPEVTLGMAGGEGGHTLGRSSATRTELHAGRSAFPCGKRNNLNGLNGNALVIKREGLLTATRPFRPSLAIGGAMATICFLFTVIFLFSTPTTVQPGFDNPLALPPLPGQFLLKDVVLLAVSIWILFAARAEARVR